MKSVIPLEDPVRPYTGGLLDFGIVMDQMVSSTVGIANTVTWADARQVIELVRCFKNVVRWTN